MATATTLRAFTAACVVTLTAFSALTACSDEGSGRPAESASTPASSTSAAPTDPRFSIEKTQALDATIAALMKDDNLPAVLVLVSMPGRGEYFTAQGTADLATGRKPDRHDSFRIGSITKTFTATAILQLADEGKLRLADKLANWFPSFPNAGQITVRDLLTMRSGIADYWTDQTIAHYYDNPFEPLTDDQIITGAAANADKFVPPDHVTKYTDVNYTLLEQIVQMVAGRDIAAQLADRIIAPSKLAATSYPATDALPGGLHGYGWNPRTNSFHDKTLLNPGPAGGSGAMISTLDDLAAWARDLYKGTLLKPDTQQARLHTQPFESGGFAYGEGIAMLSNLWGHNGTISGFSTEMWYAPDLDASVVISVNRSDQTMNSESGNVLAAVVKALLPEHAG
jgi:D-alanyl-D-alanine carboxypeptidase